MLQSNARCVPYVFLLTDGAVPNEHQICQYVGDSMAGIAARGAFAPRISTLAVGRYCNHFFLKQLAVFGRGQFEVALRPHHIREQTERMLQAAATPVLTNVTLRINGGRRYCDPLGVAFAIHWALLLCLAAYSFCVELGVGNKFHAHRGAMEPREPMAPRLCLGVGWRLDCGVFMRPGQACAYACRSNAQPRTRRNVLIDTQHTEAHTCSDQMHTLQRSHVFASCAHLAPYPPTAQA